MSTHDETNKLCGRIGKSKKQYFDTKKCVSKYVNN